MKRIVVVGGGIAGVSTVGGLRANGYDGDITMIDAGGSPYDRPPLSKDYLSGKVKLADIELRPEQWYRDQQVRLISESTVAVLRPALGAVETADGTLLAADRVVLATGGGAARPPIPGSENAAIHVLRDVADAQRLRDGLCSGVRVLIVGAGLVGAEIASTAVDLGCSVVLVDPVRPPLVAAVGADMADWLHHKHRERGVVTLQAGVEAFHQRIGEIEVSLQGEYRPQVADVVVLAVGMVPRTSLATAAGLEVDGAVVVDVRQLTSNPAILAVGDVARIRKDGRLLARSEHWDGAGASGGRAAATLMGADPPPASAPWFWTDRHGDHVEAVGQMSGADHTVLRGDVGDPGFAVFGLRDGALVGAASVNQPNIVRAARRLIDRGVQLTAEVLGDPHSDLRELLKQQRSVRISGRGED
ncbi:NAD(P)/FAD-dependent oxidoreductase [Mycobacteroides abscessus]|uniref:NAD(P)/FAD-dependent oxidoreductase n=1 Tax=Mycobacteroides abscessus TaxID=36809 RepID=UPI000C268AA8|nr:FAD-dependent oxidoreductase [Mycobacteroides abscessus]